MTILLGRIAGIVLDSYDVEPQPADDPFRSEPTHRLPNLDYASDRAHGTFYPDAVEDSVAFLRGEPVRVLG